VKVRIYREGNRDVIELEGKVDEIIEYMKKAGQTLPMPQTQPSSQTTPPKSSVIA